MIRKLACIAFFASFFIVMSNSALAQDFSAYQKKWLVQGADTLPYRLLLPEQYDANKTYPVIFFLHGSGERGRDNEKQLVHGGKLFLIDSIRKKYPAIIVFPQCSVNDYWSNVLRMHDDKGNRNFSFLTAGEPTQAMKLLQLLVTNVLDEYPVNKKQVYAGGLSMGGMGTFEIVRRMNGVFAAAISICGGANTQTAKQINKTAWWIFHGGKDDVVLPEYSSIMADALKRAKANVKLTIYPNANHNSWDSSFAEPLLLPWLFSISKK